MLVFLTNHVESAGLSSVRRWEICDIYLKLFPSSSPRSGMPRLPRKRMLDKILTTGIGFPLLPLSSSRDDVLAGVLGHGVKSDASLYSFPVTLGYSMLRKMCHSWLGVWFFLLRRWCVVKLGLNICFFLLSHYLCLLGCCYESITCFFLYRHWWK